MKTQAYGWLGLAVAVGVCFAAAGVGGRFTASSVGDWYAQLKKPSWTPPNWVFGPVWTALYLAMAVAAWLVWRRVGFGQAGWALGLFGVQLALNVLWSALFFGLRSPGAAFADIVALWQAIAATTIFFWRAVPLAGWLMLPYWLWVSFAAVLNLAVWQMNP